MAGQACCAPTSIRAASLMDDSPKDLEAKRRPAGGRYASPPAGKSFFKCGHPVARWRPDGAQILLQRAVAAYPEYAAKVFSPLAGTGAPGPCWRSWSSASRPFPSKAPEISAGGFPPALPARH